MQTFETLGKIMKLGSRRETDKTTEQKYHISFFAPVE